MSLMDLAAAALAVALLVRLTGLNNHPATQAILAAVYATAALAVTTQAPDWRFIIYALATGYVAVLLSHLLGMVAPTPDLREVRSVNLRGRVPRL